VSNPTDKAAQNRAQIPSTNPATSPTPPSDQMLANRRFMHCPPFEKAMDESDQKKGLPHPPHAKLLDTAADASATAATTDTAAARELITLPDFADLGAELGPDGPIIRDSYADLLDTRRSKRVYFDEPMTQAQLAFLLWSAIGIQEFRGANDAASLRPSPSGGARHPFNLYVAVNNIEGLEPGLYLYLPLENVGEKRVTIARVGDIAHYRKDITGMLAGQRWASRAPAVIFVTCDAYRAEWRYATASHRVMLIDLGHLGQNLMLSATAMGLGSCCLAAYNQAKCDEVLGVDGVNEYMVYGISVGKTRD